MFVAFWRMGRGAGRDTEARHTFCKSVNSSAVQLTFFGGGDGGHRSWSLPGGVPFSPSELPIVLCLANEVRWARRGV